MKKLLAVLLFALSFCAQAQTVEEIHVCKCDNIGEVYGAHLLCVPGSDANDGLTPSTPKLSRPSASTINSIAAGRTYRVLHCRGGFWDNEPMIQFNGYQYTAGNRLIFDAYEPPSGAAGLPGQRAAGDGTPNGTSPLYQTGGYNDSTWRGGFSWRNLWLIGPAAGGDNDGAIFFQRYTQDIEMENIRVEGWYSGWIGDYEAGEVRCRRMTIRNSTFSNNGGNGFLGSCSDLTMEDSLIEANNPSGSGLQHGIYQGSRNLDSRIVLRRNRFINNSVNGGTCTGGNLTIRSSKNQVLLEDNYITVPAASDTCYGISITTGYGDYNDEVMYRVVVRGNTIVGAGKCMVLQITPYALVENNRCYNTASTGGLSGINVENSDEAIEGVTAAPTGTIIRNNTIYLGATTGNGACIVFSDREGLSAGNDFQVYNNVCHIGATSSARCFNVFSTTARFTIFDYNWCYNQGSGGYSAWHGNLTEARAAGFDTNGGNTNPQIDLTTPTAWNDTALQAQTGSPLIGAGRNTGKPLRDYLHCQRSTTPTIGAHEYGASTCNSPRAPIVH